MSRAGPPRGGAGRGAAAWPGEGGRRAEAKQGDEDCLNAEDVLGQWLGERCVVSVKIEFTAASALYTNWKEWREGGNLPPGSGMAFWKRLEERGFTQKSTKAANGFVGLGFLPKAWHREEAGGGDGGSPDIGRKAREGANHHQHPTNTPYMGRPSIPSTAEPTGSRGGPCLSPVALLRDTKAAGLRLTVEGPSLRIAADREPPPVLLARLRTHKAEMLALLRGDACLHCGRPMAWPKPVGVAFADGTAACHPCYAAAMPPAAVAFVGSVT